MSNFQTLGLVTGGIQGTNPSIFSAVTTDSLGTLTATGYLNDLGDKVKLNDRFYINYSDTSVQPVGGGNANEASIFGIFSVVVSGANVSLVASPASAGALQISSVAITAAQWIAMYATPLAIITAPGAGKLIVVQNATLAMTYGTTQFTGGGATGLQYGATAHLAAPKATATLAGATIDGIVASTSFLLAGALTAQPSSTTANTGIYISNDTAAYAAGDSTFVLTTYYNVIAAA